MKKESEKPEDFSSKAVSIHDMDLYIHDEAYDGFAYDRYRRLAFMDHIVPLDTQIDETELYLSLGAELHSTFLESILDLEHILHTLFLLLLLVL